MFPSLVRHVTASDVVRTATAMDTLDLLLKKCLEKVPKNSLPQLVVFHGDECIVRSRKNITLKQTTPSYMGPAMGATGTKAHGAIGGEPSREDSVNPSPPPTNGDKPTPAARMRTLVSAAAAIATSS